MADPIGDMLDEHGFYEPEADPADEELLDAGPAPKIPKGPYAFNCPKALLGAKGKLKRAQLALKICTMLDEDVADKGELWDSADQVDELYLGRDVQSLTPLWDDAPTYNAQTLRNKCQDLNGYLVGPMVQNDPYFILRAGGPNGNPVDAVQSVLHFFMHRGKWPLALDEAGNLTIRRGRCPMRVIYVPSRPGRQGNTIKPRFKFAPVDTRYFTAYPNYAAEFEEMRLLGLLDQCRVQEIAEKQKAKHYFDDVRIHAGAQIRLTMGNTAGDKQTPSPQSVFTEDDAVDRFSGLLRSDLDGDGYEELYHVVVARQIHTLLFCEEHQLDQVNFADYFFERETNRYFNEASVGTGLVGPHHHVNDTLNMSTWLTTYVAVPPIYAENWSFPDEVIRSRPGEMTSVDSIGNSVSGGGKVDLGMFPGLHELARRIADECGHISQAGTGSQYRPGTTATEASQVWAGQMAGVSSLSRKFAFGAIDTAKIVLEYLYWNFDEWYPLYADVLAAGLKRDDFAQDYWIEINGETPNTTPQAVLQQITMFLQALLPVLQADPMLLQRYPDMIPGLVRAFLESTTIPGKESVLPTREEEAAQQQQAAMQQNIAQTIQQHLAAGQAGPVPNGGAPGQPGVGVPRPPMGATVGGAPGQPGANPAGAIPGTGMVG